MRTQKERKTEGICHYYGPREFGFLQLLGCIFELLRHQFSEVALVATNFSTNLVLRVLSLLSRSRERTLGTRLQTLLALTLALTSPCLGLIWNSGKRCCSANQPLHLGCFCTRDRRADWTKQRCRIVVDPTTKKK